ncbi:MAG TPA: TonB-dependent receptor, partial [Hyphomonas sp.]|nr:TonB-dependent receptor [Hyphomonas sp.]
MGAPVILQHSVDFRGGTPIQSYTIDDSVRGNGNGVLDAGDLGTQVQRSNSSNMQHEIDEFDLRFVWDFDDRTSLTVGSNFRDSQMDRTTRTTQQDLGSWGISNPGDVEQFAPGVMQTYCLSCLFDDVAVGQADTAFRVDATQLYPILEAAYAGNGVNISESDDTVQEEILSFYAQFNIERDFMGLPTRTNIGVRYEDTNVKSTTVQSIPSGILWQSDNDFLIVQSGAQQDLSGKGA